MADWRNRMDQITNKVKSQLFAKGVDNMNQLNDIFMVSITSLKDKWRGRERDWSSELRVDRLAGPHSAPNLKLQPLSRFNCSWLRQGSCLLKTTDMLPQAQTDDPVSHSRCFTSNPPLTLCVCLLVNRALTAIKMECFRSLSSRSSCPSWAFSWPGRSFASFLTTSIRTRTATSPTMSSSACSR